VPLLTNKDVSLLMRGKLYTSCVHSCMLPGSETRPVKKENKLTLKWAEMRMIGWMCGIKAADSFICSKLREGLGIGDKDEKMMKRKDENDWVEKWITNCKV